MGVLAFGEPDAMDSVAPVKAGSISELILGKSNDQLVNAKATSSRMRYVNDRNDWEAILQRIVHLYKWTSRTLSSSCGIQLFMHVK